ncbi:MAG: VacJ family lipoprotein [Nitrospirae bacterium]|nr:MAG: VacJ family lipoprotein [Nitrospirota bacterium]
MQDKLMIRWMFGAGFALGVVGLSGCATGSDSLGSLDATLGLPSVTVSVAGTDGDGRSLMDALSGVTMPSVQSEHSSAVPSSSEDRSATPPVLAQADGASHLGPHDTSPAQGLQAPSQLSPQETSPAQPEAPPPPVEKVVAPQAQAAEPPAAPTAEPVTSEPVKDENYDPFAKAEGSADGMEEYDPWEVLNVKTFLFNRKLDEWIVKPVATAYDTVVPDGAEHGLSNIFHNMRTVPRLINNLFQGKFKGAGIEFGRFLLNTSFGWGGYFDFAKEAYGITTPDEDFGQTLGAYGTKPGPYLVIPILGSYTVRDISGFVVDLALDPFNILLFPFVDVKSWPQVVTNEDTILFAQIGIRAGYMANERAINIETTFEGVEETVVDLYGAVRNAYLQKRARAIRE